MYTVHSTLIINFVSKNPYELSIEDINSKPFQKDMDETVLVKDEAENAEIKEESLEQKYESGFIQAGRHLCIMFQRLDSCKCWVMIFKQTTLPSWRKDDQTVALRGSKSRNKVLK